MGKRVALSESVLEFVEIGEHYTVIVKSINLYYSHVNPAFDSLFQFYTEEELEKEKEFRLQEIDASLALTLLASIEASFRIDFFQRCYNRKKDPLSLKFRELYKKKDKYVSLEDELFDRWKKYSNVPKSSLGDLKGAFKYRHWLAHGRYWIPKLGRRYDFLNIFDLAITVDESFHFEK